MRVVILSLKIGSFGTTRSAIRRQGYTAIACAEPSENSLSFQGSAKTSVWSLKRSVRSGPLEPVMPGGPSSETPEPHPIAPSGVAASLAALHFGHAGFDPTLERGRQWHEAMSDFG